MIEIEYDGTNYSGWQIQPNARSVQEEIMKALKKITNEEIKLNAAGRTDAGVHAKGQVANFYLNASIPTNRIVPALNSNLAQDITVLNAKEVPLDFHARYSAESKKYLYNIYNSSTRSSLFRNYSYHVTNKLSISKMENAAKKLIGTHDFKAFMSSGSSVQDTVRTIYTIKIDKHNNNICLSFHGNGFLYNMVRIIVGTLVEIGTDKRPIEDIEQILLSKDRRKAGHTAPPQGLILEKVYYPS
ncbi:tRNA pseudouridine38-40 synthase [Serpentinicella alkaliphila]|uniref:tRNA pseudouridine synthase A n=2 Tax=Serpentinicella alkaliphila TaxID=1734049 RepID=A0A4R2TH78_9FIRM|nr:tRNA pseudouridine38-40 synthase [Serpentinicella alkaliphila]